MKSPQRYTWYELPFGPVKVIEGPRPEHPYISIVVGDGGTVKLPVDEFYRLKHEAEYH